MTRIFVTSWYTEPRRIISRHTFLVSLWYIIYGSILSFFNFLQKSCSLDENITLRIDSAASRKCQGQPSYFSWPPLEAEPSILIFRDLKKLWKATVSFVMPVCPSAWNNAALILRVLRKFDVWVLFADLSRKSIFH